jgi:hypothetical protein
MLSELLWVEGNLESGGQFEDEVTLGIKAWKS